MKKTIKFLLNFTCVFQYAEQNDSSMIKRQLSMSCTCPVFRFIAHWKIMPFDWIKVLPYIFWCLKCLSKNSCLLVCGIHVQVYGWKFCTPVHMIYFCHNIISHPMFILLFNWNRPSCHGTSRPLSVFLSTMILVITVVKMLWTI